MPGADLAKGKREGVFLRHLEKSEESKVSVLGIYDDSSSRD